MRRIQDLPAGHRAGPFAGNFGERDQPRAGVLAALGVVGRGRGHAVRPFPRAGLHRRVKGVDGKRPGRGVAADLVEREQAVVAIERGILQRLRHHRAGELLHLQREAAHARRAVRGPAGLDQVHGQRIAQEIEDAVVGGEPVRARSFDRLRDQRAIMLRRHRPRSDRCDRPGNAGRRVRAPAAGCRRNSRGWNNVRRRSAPAAAAAP